MLKTTANKITLLRIALIPVFLILAYLDYRWPALIVFILASLSDLLDGYIARHYHQITNFGKFTDPLADKMLVLAAMCFFVEKGQMPGWVMALVLFREFAVSGLRLVAAEQNRVIAAAWSGKVKTTCTMVGLCFMMVFGKYEAMNIFVSVVILATTVYSGIEYFTKNRDVFRDAD
ncbi:MAG: CDP-diacylglycerol--glycerol-3-phosphate 3-phosphatidyltransferase [Oscillospiraceae bacterium]|nr:CDP-diacylglycerol--glycerol-3-phosphate 3-phosphatidyltransferase [Oscillospiraceae bacterium]